MLSRESKDPKPDKLDRPGASQTVLAINASPDLLTMLQNLPCECRFDISVANVDTALDLFGRAQFDLIVISDLVPVDATGVELCRKIKAEPVNCDTPILLLEGRGVDDARIMDALDSGVDDYVRIDAPANLIARKVGLLISQCAGRRARDRAGAALDKRIQESLRAIESLQRALDLKEAVFQGSPDAIFISDEDARFTVVNAAACRLTGYSVQELLGMRIPDLHEDVDLDAFRTYHERIMTGAEIVSEAKILRKDGVKIDVEFNNRRIIIGNRILMHSVARDVERRKKADEELKRSEERYRAVMSQSVNCIFLIDVESRKVVDANDALLRLLGYSREEILELDLYDLVAHDRASIDHNVDLILGRGSYLVGERRYRRKDGTAVEIEISAYLISYCERRAFCVAGVDITDRKRMERALRESEERYRDLFENANDIIYTLDLNGNFTSANKAAERSGGFTQEEFLKMNREDLVAPEHRGLGAEAIRRMLAGEGALSYQGDVISKDGRRLTMEVNTRLIYKDGVPVGVQGIGRDVTERKIAEERLKQFAAKLERSNDELANFAYIASHDLQEPLRKVQAFGDRLKAKFGPLLGPQGLDYLERMQSAAKRMQTLITDLLKLSRVTTKGRPFSRVDLSRIAGEVISDLEVQIEQTGGTVEVCKLPTVDADATQIRQLFQNLIGNALKFHRPAHPPVVSIRAAAPGELGKPPGHHPREDAFCHIIVEDNGIGFEPEYVERVFAPFQRLHGRVEYEGTGIGLTVCRKIVERHGGAIRAESVPESGTRFVVTLPLRQTGVDRSAAFGIDNGRGEVPAPE